MNRLKGKVAVVTGASKGIGASIAEHLAAEGATVAVNYVSSKNGADAVVARIKQKGGKAIAIQGDVSKPEDIQRLFSEIKEELGRVDVLVNKCRDLRICAVGIDYTGAHRGSRRRKTSPSPLRFSPATTLAGSRDS